jgi:hypothetical protein
LCIHHWRIEKHDNGKHRNEHGDKKAIRKTRRKGIKMEIGEDGSVDKKFRR